MPASLKIELTPESQRLLAATKQWPQTLPKAIKGALDVQLELTVGHIQKVRLIGVGPFPVSEGRLGNRSNRLRQSINATPAQQSGNAFVASIGSNVKYAGAHEFGFNGTVQVKSHRRKAPGGDRFKNGSGGTISRFELQLKGIKPNKKAQLSSGTGTVKAFSRVVNIPARAPFRRGIEDRLPQISAGLSAAIVKTLTTPTA